MIRTFAAILKINQLFLKLNQFICNELPVSPILSRDNLVSEALLEKKNIQERKAWIG